MLKRVALLAAVLVALLVGSAEAKPPLTFDRAKEAIHNSTPIDWPILRCHRIHSRSIQCVSRVAVHGQWDEETEVGICFLMWKRVVLRDTIRVREVNFADRCEL